MAKQQSEVLGLEQMLGILKELPENMQKNALSSIARAGAVALQKEAYSQLQIVLPRTVSRDDVVVKKRRSRKGQVRAEYHVGPPVRKPQLRWLHNGTEPHIILAHHAGVLASRDEFFGEIVNHPGQQPRPWLQRAYFMSENASIKAMAKATAKALVRQTKALRSKKYRDTSIRNIRRHFGGGRLFG